MLIGEFDDEVCSYLSRILPMMEIKVKTPWKNCLKSKFFIDEDTYLMYAKYFLIGSYSLKYSRITLRLQVLVRSLRLRYIII